MHPEDEFIFIFDRAYDPTFIFGDNVKPVVVSPPARDPILWKIWFDYRLPQILKKEKADLFFSPDGYLSLNTNVPTLLTIHDLAYLHYPEQVPNRVHKYYKKYTPKYLQKAHAIVTVSNFVKQDIQSHFKEIDENKIHAVPNACRTSFQAFDESQKQNILQTFNGGKPYFFFVGAIHPRKNVLGLLQAFEKFAHTNDSIDLLVAGRMAWQNTALKKAYEQLKNKERIKFLGYVDDGDLNKLMSGAEAFLYPSFFEGFGLPILEAFHAGVPVLTSKVSSMPEVAGNAALLVDPQDTNEITEAMHKLADSKALRNKLIEAGKIQRDQFSWDKAAENIYALLKKIKPVS